MAIEGRIDGNGDSDVMSDADGPRNHSTEDNNNGANETAEKVVHLQDSEERHPNNRQNGHTCKHILNSFYKHRGIPIVVFACLLSAFHSVFVGYVKEQLHPMQVSFTRFLLQLVFPIPLMIYQGVGFMPETRRVGLMLIARGIFGMAALTLFFYALYFTRVGDATAIFFGSPVFACIFARIFIKEAIGVVEVILVFVVIGGVFLIAQPPFIFGGEGDEDIESEFIGALLALLACILLALTTVLMRKMGTMHINSTKIVCYYGMVASIGTGILTTALGAWKMPSCGKVRFALVGLGIMNSASQCLITYSLSIEKVAFVTTLRTNEVVFAFLLDFLLFQVSPEVFSLIGSAMVITASVVLAIKKLITQRQMEAKREKEENTTIDNDITGNQELLKTETQV